MAPTIFYILGFRAYEPNNIVNLNFIVNEIYEPKLYYSMKKFYLFHMVVKITKQVKGENQKRMCPCVQEFKSKQSR